MQRKPLCYAEINLKNLRWNIREIKKKVPSVFLPVIKTDAYGVGLKEVAQVLSEEGVDKFCLSDINEAFILKENNLKGDLIILNPVASSELRECIRNNFVFPVWDKLQLKEIKRYSEKEGKRPRIQIEVDTGMGRCGVPMEKAHFLVSSIINENSFEPFGIFTHFSKAEDDDSFTQDQLAKFLNFLNSNLIEGNYFKFVHASNSASVLKFKEKVISSPFNSFRLGLLLYGVKPAKNIPSFLNLKPTVKVKSKIIKIETLKRGSYIGYGGYVRLRKNTRIGVVYFGYSKGILRNMWKNGYFIVNKKRVKILGSISMDLAVVDLSNVPEAKPGDEVIIVGKEGKESIDFNEIASWSGTIPHEVFVKIMSSLPKIYKK